MLALIKTIDLALYLYWCIIIAAAIFSWLYAFNVVNPRNQFVGMIGKFLFQATEPALRPANFVSGLEEMPVVFTPGPLSA